MTPSRPSPKGSTEKTPLWVVDLGREPYRRTWDLQKRLAQARRGDRIPDVLLFVEHDPVFTMGRRGRSENLLLGTEALQARGMACIETERGGDVTYHGPGQLVGYPIVRVPGGGKRVLALVKRFEEVLLQTLASFGVTGRRDPRNPGAWVGKAKIGSIGLAVRQEISFHGFSLNADMDLTPFSWIHTCGHPDLAITSLRDQLGQGVSMHGLKERVASIFVDVLHYRHSMPDPGRGPELEALGLPRLEHRFRRSREDTSGWIVPGERRSTEWSKEL
jgi:lipoate-protein ligase B